MLVSPGFDLGLMAVFGLLVGSFLNVVIYRLPLMLEAQWQSECAEQCGQPADARADRALDQAFAELTGHAPARAEQLRVSGRSLIVPLAAQGVARFDFSALCATALGAGDYLALATHYHCLVLDGIPRLSPENFDEARRFIVLIDALYDHRVKLVASAAAMPDELYMRGEGAKAFERTASRLEEMQSQDYLALPHLT